MKKLPVLYVFVRTELPSMTPGKAQAHSAHAANAFIYQHYIKANNKPIKPVVLEWVAQTPYGFGTQINLKAPWYEVERMVESLIGSDIAAECVVDPTYPYIVDSEIVKLIDPKLHSEIPFDLEDGRYLCHRSEATAAYVFGYKEDLVPYVGKYPLHP